MPPLKPELYLHVGLATHFLQWEKMLFKKYFTLVDNPSEKTVLFAFGPDVIEESAKLPAKRRVAYALPGFGHNPVYNHDLRRTMHEIINNYYDVLFINPGPLELAYGDLEKTKISPFSISPRFSKYKKYRKSVHSLLHLSSDSPQKDWQRSEEVMKKTGLPYEIYPPRGKPIPKDFRATLRQQYNRAANQVGTKKLDVMPHGYAFHNQVIKKYLEHDGFVHIARNIEDGVYIDGKYTASLIEAGATGAILFWHDTFSLGNGLDTVFNIPLDIDQAAQRIQDISSSLNVLEHSKKTREEMLSVFSASKSVEQRAEIILALL